MNTKAPRFMIVSRERVTRYLTAHDTRKPDVNIWAYDRRVAERFLSSEAAARAARQRGIRNWEIEEV